MKPRRCRSLPLCSSRMGTTAPASQAPKPIAIRMIVPCTRTFGPKCLLHFYPRRCGGLSPVTALIEYRRQADRLKLLRRYRAILTDSTHMRDEYLRHGFDPNTVIRSSYLRDTSPGLDTAIESAT